MKGRINITPQNSHKELIEGQSSQLLKELHIITPHGSINADTRRKLKQVNHLFGLIKPALDDVFSRFENPVALDVGAGKAYLGFILTELYFEPKKRGQIISVETREELVEKAQKMAERLGYVQMSFQCTPVSEFKAEGSINLVTALHACDTATDDALLLGVKNKCDYMALVPCCQAEVAELLKGEKSSLVRELWGHGIHRREFGSHLTNVIRAMALEACGYSVTVTELVGWEHSLKNEFILAKKVRKENLGAKKKLFDLISQIRVHPKVVRELFPEI